MKAAVLYGKGDLRMEDRGVPVPGAGEVLVRIRACGVCGTDAALFNVSRGAVVDEEALVEALASKRLGGAGLDVFVAEPLPKGSRLRSFPHVGLSDHSAYASRESIRELRKRTAENALAALTAAGLAVGPASRS